MPWSWNWPFWNNNYPNQNYPPGSAAPGQVPPNTIYTGVPSPGQPGGPGIRPGGIVDDTPPNQPLPAGVYRGPGFFSPLRIILAVILLVLLVLVLVRVMH